MPVFRNPYYVFFADLRQSENPVQHETVMANALSDEEIASKAESIISALGLEISSTSFNHPIPWLRNVSVNGDGVEVTVYSIGSVSIAFEGGYLLPEGLSLAQGHQARDEAIVHVTEKFAPILGVSHISPDANITERILDYHFNNMFISPNYEGQLSHISMSSNTNIVLADKIGYFPIISPSQAIDSMLAGYGLFGINMEQQRPMEDDVIDMRLVYFGHDLGRSHLEAFAPWYEIIVQTSDVHHVQSWFVPAVQSDYLENNPAWTVYPYQDGCTYYSVQGI